MRWLRLYAETIDDAKLRLLAFEDRWHFVAILCMKAQGILDEQPNLEMLSRVVAVKLGLTIRDAEEVRRRLIEVHLVADDWQPTAWAKRQFMSDQDLTGAERQRRFREKHSLPLRNALRNGPVTRESRSPDTDTDPEIKTGDLVSSPSKFNSVVFHEAVSAEPLADSRSTPSATSGTSENVPREIVISLPLNTGQDWAVSQDLLDEWISLYPGTDVLQELRKMRAWCLAKPANRKTWRGIKAFVVNWLNRAHDSRRDTQLGASRHLSAVERVRLANQERLAALREASDA